MDFSVQNVHRHLLLTNSSLNSTPNPVDSFPTCHTWVFLWKVPWKCSDSCCLFRCGDAEVMPDPLWLWWCKAIQCRFFHQKKRCAVQKTMHIFPTFAYTKHEISSQGWITHRVRIQSAPAAPWPIFKFGGGGRRNIFSRLAICFSWHQGACVACG